MRINDPYNTLAIDHSAGTSQQGKVGANHGSHPKNGAAATHGAVKVTVSAKARELALAHSASDVDEAKVASLRSAIQDGTLKVDSQKIADRIVDGE